MAQGESMYALIGFKVVFFFSQWFMPKKKKKKKKLLQMENQRKYKNSMDYEHETYTGQPKKTKKKETNLY